MNFSCSIRILIFTLLLIICSPLAYGQGWVRSWGGTGTDISGRVTISGTDFVHAVTTTSYGAGQTDIMIVKTDSAGNMIWQQLTGTPAAKAARGIVSGPSGEIYVAGEATGPGGKDVYLAKLDAAGNILWTKSFPGLNYESASAIAISDSCIALSCDVSIGGAYASKDITILGVDTSGNQLWSTSFGTPSGMDYASDIAPLHDGGFVIGGNIRPSSTQFGFLIRLNASGDTLWTKTLPYDNNLSVGSCIQLQGDSLVAFGANWHTLVLRMNGEIKSNQENANGNTTGITSCSDGGYAIISSSNRVLQKYTHEGVQAWGNYIQYNNPYYLKQCSDGGFIISGYGDFCGSPSNLLIVKTDSAGNYNIYTGITPVISGNSYPVCPGDTVTISVPGGFDSYQWYRQYGTPTLLTGENDSVLQITGGGSTYHYYYCVLTRGMEQFITNVAYVTYLITWVPEISPSGPVNFCYPGNSITLEFNEAYYHHYQWNLNGVPIPGASGYSYTPTISGTYTVSAWRLCDTVVSAPVIVNTNAPPVASLNSYYSYVTIITSTGAYCESSNPLTAPVVPGNSYQWLYNGNPTGGTTNQLYPGTPGSYQVITTNACGTDTSGNATHYENYLVIAIYSNGPVSGCGADTVVLQFSPWGYSNVQWYKNGIAISGANLDSLVVTTSGTYSCSMDVMCDFGNETATSNSMTVTVNPNPLPSISASGNTVICSGTVLLTATPGGTGYAWYKNNQTIPGANSQTYLADSSGSYRCSISSVACGNNRNTNTIIVKIGPPSEYITCSNTNICQGSIAYLFSYTTDYASTPTVRQWRKDGIPIAGANSNSYQATLQGSYDCELINLCDTSYTNAIFITVMSIPGISPSGNVSICAGDSITLNAATGTGYTYTWYNYNVISGAISSTYTTNQAGIYRVKVNTGTCNILSDAVNVTVNTLPISNIWSSTPPVVCSNDSVWLHANNRPDYSHQWYLNNSPIASTASQIYASAGGSYTVQISDSNSCVSTSPELLIHANSFSGFPVTVNPNLPVCIGDSVTITSGVTGVAYQWFNSNTPIPGAVNSSVSTGQQGMFSVMVTNSLGCTGTSSTYITISNAPVVSSYSGPSYCGNNNGYITLTLQGGTWPYTYQWSNGDTTSLTSGLYSGNYIFTITDGAGCISVDTIPVLDLTNLNTQIYIQKDTLCAGDSTRLIAYGPAGSTFLWNTGASINEFYTSTAGNYIVTVTDSTGCSGTDTVTVTLAPPILLSLTTTGTSCSGATVNLYAGSGYANYYWNIGANTQAINISSSGNYIVTVTDSNGCTATDSTLLQFSAPVACTISGDTIVCSGNVNIIDAGTGFSSYLWNTGEITSSITPVITGTYSVLVTNANGCTATDSITVIVNPSPVVLVSASGPTVFCAGSSVVLDAGSGYSSYQWFNYSYPLIAQTSQTFTAAGNGKYSCVVSNTSTCIDTSNYIIVRVPCIQLDPPVDRSVGTSESEFDLTIYPVPANELLNISFYNEHEITITIPVTISDLNGRIVFENKIIGNPGWNEHPIDVNKFSQGIYFLSLTFPERKIIKKIAVQ